MYFEVATYVCTVLVAASLTLSHWAAPIVAKTATAKATVAHP
jgi:hypothetical protein